MKKWKISKHIGKQVDETAAAPWLKNKSFKKSEVLFNGFEKLSMHRCGVWWNALARKTYINQNCNTV